MTSATVQRRLGLTPIQTSRLRSMVASHVTRLALGCGSVLAAKMRRAAAENTATCPCVGQARQNAMLLVIVLNTQARSIANGGQAGTWRRRAERGLNVSRGQSRLTSSAASSSLPSSCSSVVSDSSSSAGRSEGMVWYRSVQDNGRVPIVVERCHRASDHKRTQRTEE